MVGKGIAEERLPADDVERDLVFLERLPRLLDVGAVVARLVGHQHDQELAVLADQARVVLDDLADRLHGVLDAGGVDLQVS